LAMYKLLSRILEDLSLLSVFAQVQIRKRSAGCIGKDKNTDTLRMS